MKKQQTLLILTLFLLAHTALAQLTIGSKLPGITISNIANYKTTTARLSDFRGKLLIIDFWSTGCKSCLKAFKKMDSLQKTFAPNLQVLLVTTESPQKIREFYQKHPNLPKPILPCVMSDKTLSALFPHVYLPHHVWIDKQGVVKYITSYGSTTEETVETFLNGGNLQLYQKHDTVVKDDAVPDRYDSRFLAFSCLMKKIQGSNRTDRIWIKDSLQRKIGLHLNSATIVDLYKAVAAKDPTGGTWYNNEVVVESPGNYFRPAELEKWDQWNDENRYRYTLWMAITNTNSLFEKMHRDLQDNFGLVATIQKRKTKCWVLICTDSVKLRSAGGKPFSFYDGEKKFVSRNLPLDWFIKMLAEANYDSPLPIVNGTGFTGLADLEFSVELDNLKELNEQMESRGLKLVEDWREIDMLVLSPMKK